MNDRIYEFVNTPLWHDELAQILGEKSSKKTNLRQKQFERWSKFLQLKKVGRKLIYTEITGEYIPPEEKGKFSPRLKKLILSSEPTTKPLKWFYKEWFLIDIDTYRSDKETYLKLSSELYRATTRVLHSLDKNGLITYEEVIQTKDLLSSVPRNLLEQEYYCYKEAMALNEDKEYRLLISLEAVRKKYNLYKIWREFYVAPKMKSELNDQTAQIIKSELNKLILNKIKLDTP